MDWGHSPHHFVRFHAGLVAWRVPTGATLLRCSNRGRFAPPAPLQFSFNNVAPDDQIEFNVYGGWACHQWVQGQASPWQRSASSEQASKACQLPHSTVDVPPTSPPPASPRADHNRLMKDAHMGEGIIMLRQVGRVAGLGRQLDV